MKHKDESMKVARKVQGKERRLRQLVERKGVSLMLCWAQETMQESWASIVSIPKVCIILQFFLQHYYQVTSH